MRALLLLLAISSAWAAPLPPPKAPKEAAWLVKGTKRLTWGVMACRAWFLPDGSYRIEHANIAWEGRWKVEGGRLLLREWRVEPDAPATPAPPSGGTPYDVPLYRDGRKVGGLEGSNFGCLITIEDE